MGERALRLELYDGDLAYQGTVGAPLTMRAVHAWSAPSSAEFALDDEHNGDLIPVLRTPGTRALVEYASGDPDAPAWEPLWSGPVEEVGGASMTDDGPASATFVVGDDLADILGIDAWPNPAGTITQQGDEDAHWTSTGPAETVAKALINANLARYSAAFPPVTIPTTEGRGSTITVTVRMTPIGDALLPAVPQAGVGLVARIDPTIPAIVVDVVEGSTYHTRLTDTSAVVPAGAWRTTRPTVTRVVVGGPGEGTARTYRTVIDAALEAAWRVVRPVHVDARDVEDTDPDLVAKLDARGDAELAAGAPTTVVDCTLAETDEFRYLGAVRLGDTLPLTIAGQDVEGVLTLAELTYTPDDGLTVALTVGEPADPESLTVRAVADVRRRVRTLEAGR